MYDFITGRIKGGGYAIKGAWLLLRHEPSIQAQFAIAIVVTFAGFYFDITATEWMMQIFAIGLVMGIEGLNTAVEDIADFVHADYHVKIGRIKDVAAGAVFIAAIISSIIGAIIYIPYIFFSD